MTSERDIERLLDRWLADRPTEVADRVLDEVAHRISRQAQHRAWRVLGRDHPVNPYLKPLLAVAAVVVIAVGGIALLGRPSGSPVGGAGSPAPSPSPTASAAPTTAPSAAASTSARWPTWFPPSAIADSNGAGILSAGSQATREFRPAFTFSALDGWVNAYDEPNFFTLFPDTPANSAQFARSGDLAQNIFMGQHGSPWFTCESVENNRGATAAEMVTAMTANEVLAVSGLVDITIGGLSGRQFDVRRNPDWTGTCPGDSGLPAGVDAEDERHRIILLDVPGRGVLVVFLYSMSSSEMEAFLAEAMPIVESFEFDLGQ